MDDLEDVENDNRSGLMTMFSQTASRWPLDSVTNRAFHYGLKMLDRLEQFDTPDLGSLWELLRIAITPLMIDSISQIAKFYTPSYIKKLEAHFPFRFAFLKKQRKRINHWNKRNNQLLNHHLNLFRLYTLVLQDLQEWRPHNVVLLPHKNIFHH